MLSVDEKLDFETIAAIFKTGYSRIPVYEVSKNNVVGLLFVKDLIFIDPEDETPILKFIQVFGRSVHVVWPVDKLGDVLRELKGGRSHMALVRDVVNDGDADPYYEIKGIITLEDIVEEILGHEIVDETDAFVDGTHRELVTRGEAFEWAKLRLLGSKTVDQKLTYSETKAIAAHLRANYPKAVSNLTENQLYHLVSELWSLSCLLHVVR
jgi:metal transporter CNNM